MSNRQPCGTVYEVPREILAAVVAEENGKTTTLTSGEDGPPMLYGKEQRKWQRF